MEIQDKDWGKAFLDHLYDAMKAAYAQEGVREDRARAAMARFEESETLVRSLQESLSRVMEFYQLLIESIRALEDARSRQDRRGRTIRGSGCLVSKLVPCGKDCNGCPHGPYLYRVQKVGGKQFWTYLGRAQG